MTSRDRHPTARYPIASSIQYAREFLRTEVTNTNVDSDNRHRRPITTPIRDRRQHNATIDADDDHSKLSPASKLRARARMTADSDEDEVESSVDV